MWVNNVGTNRAKKGEFLSEEDIDYIYAAVFKSAVFGIQSAVKYMKKGGGSIVNISSLAARCSTCGRSNIYGSMKAGLLSLTRNYAGEALEVCGGQNIVLNPWFSEEKNY